MIAGNFEKWLAPNPHDLMVAGTVLFEGAVFAAIFYGNDTRGVQSLPMGSNPTPSRSLLWEVADPVHTAICGSLHRIETPSGINAASLAEITGRNPFDGEGNLEISR